MTSHFQDGGHDVTSRRKVLGRSAPQSASS